MKNRRNLYQARPETWNFELRENFKFQVVRGIKPLAESNFIFRLLIALSLFLVCCQKEPQNIVCAARFSLVSDPVTLDSRKARELNSINLIHNLYEGLTRTAPSGETELAIARSVEVSDDGLRYLFSLGDASWSNGKPVTAFDFETTWKTILDPAFATDIAYHFYPLKNARQAKLGEVGLEMVGVQALDAKTLVVELATPVPYFFQLVSMTPFFPVYGKSHEEGRLISNGPFQLDGWEHSSCIRLVKNIHYREASMISLRRADFFIVAADTALRMYEEGELDWVGSPFSTIPVDRLSSLKDEKKLQTSPFLATAFYRLNTAERIKGRKNPLADQNVRRSLGMAIDRDAIVSHVLQGGQRGARGLVPPEMGLNQGGYFIDSVERARVLIAHSELPNEPFVISYANIEPNASIAQAVQKQWENGLGISVRLEAVEPKVFFQRISKGEFQIAAGSWVADFNDPINFLEVFAHSVGGSNHTGWEDAHYIDLLNRSALCRGMDERRTLLLEAEAILMEQMPIIPIYHFVMNYAKGSTLQGAALSPMGNLVLHDAQMVTEARR